MQKAPVAGSFFDKYPRQRKLISLNKRFTGRSEPEFNLRHDWNSLLDNPDVEPMTNRTEDRWPHADVLAEYLRECVTPPPPPPAHPHARTHECTRTCPFLSDSRHSRPHHRRLVNIGLCNRLLKLDDLFW